MNRLSHLFDSACRCCRVRRRLKRVKRECERIEMLAGSVFDFWIPSVDSYIDGDRRDVRIVIDPDIPATPIDSDLAGYAADQLRRVGLELIAAADRIGGAS